MSSKSTNIQLMFAILFGAMCTDSYAKTPRNESLLLSIPTSTLRIMEDAGMPRDTQTALAMRLDSAMCTIMYDDIRKRVIANSYAYAHDRMIFLVSNGWQTSEGHIDRKWTSYVFLSQLSVPLNFFSCKDRVQKWLEIYG